MSFANNKRKRSATALILIMLTCLLFVGNKLYMHTHHLGDGSVITHSHPFSNQNGNSSQNPGHKHSNFEIIMIQAINNSLYLMIVIVFAYAIKASSLFVFPAGALSADSYSLVPVLPGRAPPRA